jgi:hypothetical protein
MRTRIGIHELGNLQKLTNKAGIFHVKIQLFVPAKSDQDPDLIRIGFAP